MNFHYPFALPPLPYSYDALEPHISAETLRLHHDKHFETYVENLNKALADYPAYHAWPPERLILENYCLPFQIQTAVWNNAGGIYNHSLYFGILGPDKAGGPSSSLEAAMVSAFGSVQKFFEQMKEAALGQFGSGYAWLVSGSKGYLKIITTANQDTPFPYHLHPVMNLDVWEHAYYLQYRNRRDGAVDHFFEALNWERINENYLCTLPASLKEPVVSGAL